MLNRPNTSFLSGWGIDLPPTGIAQPCSLSSTARCRNGSVRAPLRVWTVCFPAPEASWLSRKTYGSAASSFALTQRTRAHLFDADEAALRPLLLLLFFFVLLAFPPASPLPFLRPPLLLRRPGRRRRRQRQLVLQPRLRRHATLGEAGAGEEDDLLTPAFGLPPEEAQEQGPLLGRPRGPVVLQVGWLRRRGGRIAARTAVAGVLVCCWRAIRSESGGTSRYL